VAQRDKTRIRPGALATFQIVICDGLLVQWLLDPDAAPSGAELTGALRLALGVAPE
jgi:hypothetical protein